MAREGVYSSWVGVSFVLFLFVALSFYVGFGSLGNVVYLGFDGGNEEIQTISIASWNLQRFGLSKVNDTKVFDSIVDKIDGYDIVVIQEITDSSGDAFDILCDRMAGYSCIVSNRTGNSSYKEQYGILYKNVTYLTQVDHDSTNFTRNPYSLMFAKGAWSFRLTTIHTDPNGVKRELSTLENLLMGDDYDGDEIVMGDLNADCSYYKTPRSDFTNWTWEIPDDADTTVKKSDCAYDRIILNDEAANNYVGYGIDGNVSSDVSDHYLIYGVFRFDVE